MSYRSHKTEVPGNDPIQGNYGAFTARLSDGSVSCWGHKGYGGDSSSVQPRLKNAKVVCASWGEFSGGAFAAIASDDTVICWGDRARGGDCSAVASELKQVEGLCGSLGAFAAIKRDGTVITWGHKDYGGDNSSVRGRLKGVRAIYSTSYAFAAVLYDGSVEAWGHEGRGGLIPPAVKQRLKQVQSISGTVFAFAALLSDGTVETWGDEDCGGKRERGVFAWGGQTVSICASELAFAALRKGGTVVCWGSEGYGGSTFRVKKDLQQVVALSSTGVAFAALRSDGSVVTWGDGEHGGDSSSVAGELKEVVAIRGTDRAFAALRKNGTVVTWGSKDHGGDSSAVWDELVQVVAIRSNGRAFAAQRRDGTVVTWGHRDYGGDSSSAPALRQAGAIQRKDRIEEKKVALKQQEREKLELAAKELREKETRAESEKMQREREMEEASKQREAEKSNLAIKGLQENAVESAKRLEAEKGESRGPEPAVLENLPSTVAAVVDGSVEFWRRRLEGVLDAEDIADSASKFSAAGFKQKHMDKLSRDDLKEAGVKQGVIKDFLEKQQSYTQAAAAPPAAMAPVSAVAPPPAMAPLPLPAMAPSPSASSIGLLLGLPRISEEELTMEEQVGEGGFSVVWRATWRRKIAVGKQLISSMQVAVKMSNRANNINELSSELARDLAVMSGLPHQNILIVYGVCEASSSSPSNKPGGALKIVYELMSTDLAKHLKAEAAKNSPQKTQQPLLPTQLLLRVLRDVSAGLAHLHSNGVIHRDVKPANVLLRDEQVKLCDFGSSRDLQHTIQQMSVAGTLSYMSPEMLNQQPSGRPADVWSFGVLLFECVTGTPCSRAHSTQELATELADRKCLPALVEMFVECHQADPRKRPSMPNIHLRLQTLVMQEARDAQRLKEELKRAEAQDKEAYDVTWNNCYGNQLHSQELMDYLALNLKQTEQSHSGSVVQQPRHFLLKLKPTNEQSPNLVARQPVRRLKGKGSMEELEQLATAKLCGRLHARLKAVVEMCGGTYQCAPRKSHERCVQKVAQEYGGDYGKLLDLERATGLFEQVEDMLRCLKMLRGEEVQEQGKHDPEVVGPAPPSSSFSPFPSSFRKLLLREGVATGSSSSSAVSLRVVRCKDRLNEPLSSGYRDLLLNVCEAESGFVMELQLNFNKIAQIKSQSHRFYELMRVMEIKLA